MRWVESDTHIERRGVVQRLHPSTDAPQAFVQDDLEKGDWSIRHLLSTILDDRVLSRRRQRHKRQLRPPRRQV